MNSIIDKSMTNSVINLLELGEASLKSVQQVRITGRIERVATSHISVFQKRGGASTQLRESFTKKVTEAYHEKICRTLPFHS